MDSEKAVGFESIEASEYIEDSGSAVDSEKVADSECSVGFEVIEDFGSAGAEGIESDLPAGEIEIVKRAGFSFELSVAELGARTEIRFFLKNGSGEREALPVTSLEYQAKLTDALANAWWSFGGYMVTFLWRERTACGLVIERAGRAAGWGGAAAERNCDGSLRLKADGAGARTVLGGGAILQEKKYLDNVR